MKERTRIVYDFIKSSDHPVTQWEIYCRLQGTGYELRWNERQNQHNDHLRKMHDIVEEINKSSEVDDFVFQHCYRYSIATEEQVKVMVDLYNAKAMKSISLRNFLVKKAKKDGQYDLVEGRWIEAFK